MARRSKTILDDLALLPWWVNVILAAVAFLFFKYWVPTGIETLRSISWREFEELVGEAYRRQGYRMTETGGGGADRGVDLILKKNGGHLHSRGQRLCKRKAT